MHEAGQMHNEYEKSLLCLFILLHFPCGSYSSLACAVPSAWNALPAFLSMTSISLLFRSMGNIFFLERSSLLTFFKVASPHAFTLYDLYSVTLLHSCYH